MALLSKGFGQWCCMTLLVSTLKEITICLRARWNEFVLIANSSGLRVRSWLETGSPKRIAPMSSNRSESPCCNNESAT